MGKAQAKFQPGKKVYNPFVCCIYMITSIHAGLLRRYALSHKIDVVTQVSYLGNEGRAWQSWANGS